jgi:hypothetical protein
MVLPTSSGNQQGTKTIYRNPHWSAKPSKIFLIIDYEGFEYTGCLLFNDQICCEQMAYFLKNAAVLIADRDLVAGVDQFWPTYG